MGGGNVGNYSQQQTLGPAAAYQEGVAGLSHHQTGLLSTMSQIDSMASPVGMYVPQSVKEKVWKGEFIDFSNLLPQNRPQVELEEFMSAYVTSAPFQSHALPASVTSQLLGATMGSQGAGFSSGASKKQITSIGDWTDAMLIFLSLYIQKHPEQTLPLIKYCTTVREAAARFGTKGALAYDASVRMKIALNPMLRWDALDNESYLLLLMPQAMPQRFQQNNSIANVGLQYNNGKQAAQTRNFNALNQPFRMGKGGTLPPGTCWGFNRGQCSRQNCKHPHRCAACGKPHPLQKCYTQLPAGKKNEGQKPN